MMVIGLTGGIASGKSTVARTLATDGVPVIDADQVAREIMGPNSPVLESVFKAFEDNYPQIRSSDGSLNRTGLRQVISQDDQARQTLNQLTHPAIAIAIATKIQALAADGHKHAIVEAALMVETGSYKMYPALIVVTTERETQLQRVMARDDCDEAAATAIIDAQLPMADKVAVATHVISNNGSQQELAQAARDVYKDIVERQKS